MAQQIRHKLRVRWARLGASLLALALGLGPAVLSSRAQSSDETKLKKDYPNANARPKPSDLSHTGKLPDPIASAVGSICLERKFDPLGSAPIDVMQAQPSLPLKNSDVAAALKRAETLLPLARELAVEALRELGAEHNIEEARLRAAETRIRAVVKIEPDVDLRDNASVSTNRPTLISFGTLFLVGLRSNEGLLSVLTHELTHLGDGKEDSLQPLFQKVGRRASGLSGMRGVMGRRAEELTCDLVGVIATRKMIVRAPSRDSLPRRLARSLEHNCVDHDETDDAHLSPRNTMRALLSLDEALAQGILGPKEISSTDFSWQVVKPVLSDAEAFFYASERCRAGL